MTNPVCWEVHVSNVLTKFSPGSMAGRSARALGRVSLYLTSYQRPPQSEVFLQWREQRRQNWYVHTVPSSTLPSQFSVQWNTGYDENVEVNQRALIDKVLARYSAEFTGMSYRFPKKADNLNTGL